VVVGHINAIFIDIVIENLVPFGTKIDPPLTVIVVFQYCVSPWTVFKNDGVLFWTEITEVYRPKS
jgi:hypothetical protein